MNVCVVLLREPPETGSLGCVPYNMLLLLDSGAGAGQPHHSMEARHPPVGTGDAQLSSSVPGHRLLRFGAALVLRTGLTAFSSLFFLSQGYLLLQSQAFGFFDSRLL